MADVVVARPRARPATLLSAQQWNWMLASAAMLLVLVAPAIWNGFPLLFSDTGGYLTRPMDGTLQMGRSAFYGILLYLSVPFAFWPIVLAQSALTAWMAVLTLRVAGLGSRPWLAFGAVAMLSLLTSLAWMSAQLIPDIFFPLAVLAVYLLAFRFDALAGIERLALAAIIAATIASHMAALGLCLALVGALWLAAPWLALPRPRMSYAAVACAAGIALALLTNFAVSGALRFTPGGTSFLFGRLVEDGIIARYLDDRCPDPTLRICAYENAIPDGADEWLWGPGTAFYKLGGAEGFAAEEKRIIADTIRLYPATHIVAVLEATAEQLVKFATEVSSIDNHPAVGTLRERTPQLMDRVMAARQQQGDIDTLPLNLVHVPIGALAMLGVIAVFTFRRRLRLPPELAALCLTVLLALLANAAICGVFSHPVDRYQSRLVPLAVLALAIVVARRGRTA